MNGTPTPPEGMVFFKEIPKGGYFYYDGQLYRKSGLQFGLKHLVEDNGTYTNTNYSQYFQGYYCVTPAPEPAEYEVTQEEALLPFSFWAGDFLFGRRTYVKWTTRRVR